MQVTAQDTTKGLSSPDFRRNRSPYGPGARTGISRRPEEPWFRALAGTVEELSKSRASFCRDNGVVVVAGKHISLVNEPGVNFINSIREIRQMGLYSVVPSAHIGRWRDVRCTDLSLYARIFHEERSVAQEMSDLQQCLALPCANSSSLYASFALRIQFVNNLANELISNLKKPRNT